MRVSVDSEVGFLEEIKRSQLVETIDRFSSITRLTDLLDLTIQNFWIMISTELGRKGDCCQGDLNFGEISLLNHDDLLEAVRVHRFPWPRMRLVKGGEHLAPASFLRTIKYGREGAEVFPRGPEMAQLMRDGATLIVDGLEQFSEPLADLADDMSFIFGVHPTINAYLSPGHALGLGRHCDDHDVLVLQLEGAKQWLVWPPTASDMMNEGQAAYPSGQPTAEITIKSPGWAWIPRGWWHAPNE